MSLNFCKRDIKSIRCDYCRQMTTQWISICDHHQPLTSSESISETDGLSEDSGLGEITYANSFHMQKNNWCFRSRVNYLLFGTYLFYCQPIEITDPFFYFAYISPNSSLIGKTYHMRISFEDIKELLHCSILGNFLLFIELKRSTSLFIERSMNLNGGGRKGLRFDVDSDDVVERYIVIDFDETQLDENGFAKVIQTARETNKVVVREMFSRNVVHYLKNNYKKSISRTK